MKKIISLVILTVSLIWSWNLIHSSPSVSFETHAIIQQRLAEIIEQSVLKHRPEAQNFNLVRLWTEANNHHKVTAHFTYQFQDGETESKTQQTVSGEAFLVKTSAEGTSQENWRVERVSTASNALDFEEGVLITPQDTETTMPPAQDSSPQATPSADPMAPSDDH